MLKFLQIGSIVYSPFSNYMSVSISLHQHLIYISDFSFLFLPNRLSPIVSCLGLRFSGCWWKLTTFHMLIDHLSSVKHVHLIFFFFLLDSPLVSVYQNFLKTVLLKSYEFLVYFFFPLVNLFNKHASEQDSGPCLWHLRGSDEMPLHSWSPFWPHWYLPHLTPEVQKCTSVFGFFFPPCFCSFWAPWSKDC